MRITSDARPEQGSIDVKLAHLPQLDGLRAVAVALVLVHHLLQPTRFGGWIGVDIFFVLSGYLITSLLGVEVARTGRVHLRKFYARRLLRLYPPLILAVLVLLPLGLVLYPSRTQYLASSALALTYSTNLVATFLDQWVGPWTHSWTLALEEQFYLLWPLLLLAAVRIRRSLPTVGNLALGVALVWVVLAAAFHVESTASSYNPILQGPPLLAGCGLALTNWWRNVARSSVVAFASLLILAAAVTLGSVEALHGVTVATATLGSLLLIAHLSASRSSVLVSALSIGPLVAVGLISYEIYLWHYPLLILLAPVVPSRVVVVVAVVVGSVALSIVSKRWVSNPITQALKPRLQTIGTGPRP